jgi:rhodanese-related sulfurtransferase
MNVLFSLLLATVIQTKADVPRVTPAELQALLAKGDAIAVDVRGTVPFRYGHIASAISMPLGAIDKRAMELPQDKLIVTYCACRSEETSLEGAMLLAQKHGFERVAVLHGGLQAWTDARLPTESERTVHFEEERPAAEAGRGRLAPPAAVKCDRNELTSYERKQGRTTIVIATSAGTTERVTLEHSGSDDPSRAFLLAGEPFAADDWKKIEKEQGVLHDGMNVIAWVCENGETIVDWRPGSKPNRAE